MRSGILSNGKKDREHTHMKRFMHLFVGSICIIGFVCAMMSAYKYVSNLKMFLFYMFVGLMNCMFAISEIKDYLKY